MIEYVKAHGRSLFDGSLGRHARQCQWPDLPCARLPSPVLIVVLGAAHLDSAALRHAGDFRRSRAAVHHEPGLLDATLETLSLVMAAALVSAAIGVPLGIAAAHRPRLYAAMRPVLDLMQTLPTFVYLIPTLVLFGLGVVPGLISTVIFALPAPIRLTQLGICSVPKPLLEAGEAFGATRLRCCGKSSCRAPRRPSSPASLNASC